MTTEHDGCVGCCFEAEPSESSHCTGCLQNAIDKYQPMRNYAGKQAIKGVSPDEPIIANANGGKQAKSAYAFHLCDPDAMLALAEVMQQGAEKYERNNWRKIPAEEHFNHMVIHWYAWLKGDRTDDHLAHMFTRSMMCYATAKAEEAGHA